MIRSQTTIQLSKCLHSRFSARCHSSHGERKNHEFSKRFWLIIVALGRVVFNCELFPFQMQLKFLRSEGRQWVYRCVQSNLSLSCVNIQIGKKIKQKFSVTRLMKREKRSNEQMRKFRVFTNVIEHENISEIFLAKNCILSIMSMVYVVIDRVYWQLIRRELGQSYCWYWRNARELEGDYDTSQFDLEKLSTLNSCTWDNEIPTHTSNVT